MMPNKRSDAALNAVLAAERVLRTKALEPILSWDLINQKSMSIGRTRRAPSRSA